MVLARLCVAAFDYLKTTMDYRLLTTGSLITTDTSNYSPARMTTTEP